MEDTNVRCESIQIETPDHSNELSKAEEAIEKIKNRLKIIAIQRSIDDKSHDKMFEDVIRVLLYIGDLSKSIFDIGDQLEERYIKAYIKTPELAKTLWLKHYDELHHPYNLLKNRCYKLLEELDAQYHKKFKKHPPNWKI
jgi:hypothetical protein